MYFFFVFQPSRKRTRADAPDHTWRTLTASHSRQEVAPVVEVMTQYGWNYMGTGPSACFPLALSLD